MSFQSTRRIPFSRYRINYNVIRYFAAGWCVTFSAEKYSAHCSTITGFSSVVGRKMCRHSLPIQLSNSTTVSAHTSRFAPQSICGSSNNNSYSFNAGRYIVCRHVYSSVSPKVGGGGGGGTAPPFIPLMWSFLPPFTPLNLITPLLSQPH